MGRPSLAAAAFQPVGEEELELQLAPGTVSGFHGVQMVADDCYQAKIKRKGGGGFVSLPASSLVLIAAWWFAKATKERDHGTLDSPSFKAFMKQVRLPHSRYTYPYSHSACCGALCRRRLGSRRRGSSSRRSR